MWTNWAEIHRQQAVEAFRRERYRWEHDPALYFMELRGWRPETLAVKRAHRRLALLGTAVLRGQVSMLGAVDIATGIVRETFNAPSMKQRYRANLAVGRGEAWPAIVAILREEGPR